jgi:hypothetical protein
VKRRLPLGIQDFASIREDGYCYADMTSLLPIHGVYIKGIIPYIVPMNCYKGLNRWLHDFTNINLGEENGNSVICTNL